MSTRVFVPLQAVYLVGGAGRGRVDLSGQRGHHQYVREHPRPVPQLQGRNTVPPSTLATR